MQTEPAAELDGFARTETLNSPPTLSPDQGSPIYADPLTLRQHKRANVTRQHIKQDFTGASHRKIKKFYMRQNDLIDQFLQGSDEERLAVLDMKKNDPKIMFAIYASSIVHVCLFVIQSYAAISTDHCLFLPLQQTHS